MLNRQETSQAQRLAKLLERGAYRVSEEEARRDWQGETSQAKYQGAAQSDRAPIARYDNGKRFGKRDQAAFARMFKEVR